MCAFCRALRRHVAKLRRIELAPDLSRAAERPPTRSCTTEEDCRLDAEKAARQLSERGRQMYALRHAGFEWREIAEKLNITDAAARAEFSRELKRARLKLRKKSPTETDSRDRLTR
jgi:DNA-directed RNA polymerase specialized sigma24 family protein